MSSELIEAVSESSYHTYNFPLLPPEVVQRSILLDDFDIVALKRGRRDTLLDSTETRATDESRPDDVIGAAAVGSEIISRDAVIEETRGKKRARRKTTKGKEPIEPQQAQWILESADFPPGQVWLEPRPKKRPQPVTIPPQIAVGEVALRGDEMTTVNEPLSYDRDQVEIAAIILQKRRENELTQWRQRMLRQQQKHRGEPDREGSALEAKHDELSRRMELSAQGDLEDAARRGDNRSVDTSFPSVFGDDREETRVVKVQPDTRTGGDSTCDGLSRDDTSPDSDESDAEIQASETTSIFAAQRQQSSHRKQKQTAMRRAAIDRFDATARDTRLSTQPGRPDTTPLQPHSRSSPAHTEPSAHALASTSGIVVATAKESRPSSNGQHFFDAYRTDDEDMLARNLQLLSGHGNFVYTGSSTRPAENLTFPFYPFSSGLRELHEPRHGSHPESYPAAYPLPLSHSLPRASSPCTLSIPISNPAADTHQTTSTSTAIAAAAATVAAPNSIPTPDPTLPAPPQTKTTPSNVHMNMFTGQAREPGVIGGNYTPNNNAQRRNMFSNR